MSTPASPNFDRSNRAGPEPVRRLAQLSFLLAAGCALATVVSLLRLPNAAASGQLIVVATGAILALCAFSFGVMLSLRKPRARRIGFVVVAAGFAAAALFGLLALVVPESSLMFSVWAVVLLSYAGFTAHRLVHWPDAEVPDLPRSELGIFISYRREDSKETVGRIHDHLRQGFREDRLFLDVERQLAGEDYRVSIASALERADVLLAVIGAGWLTATDRKGRRRIDDPNDLVRIEIASALERDLRVIPVLIHGATMPAPTDLPPSLHALCYRSAVPVRPDPDFSSDMRRLVAALGETVLPRPFAGPRD